MLMCVRTTIEIPDALLVRARERALARGTTLREVVADALRFSLEDESPVRAHGVRVQTYGGSGLAPGVTEADLFSREERELAPTRRPEPGTGR